MTLDALLSGSWCPAAAAASSVACLLVETLPTSFPSLQQGPLLASLRRRGVLRMAARRQRTTRGETKRAGGRQNAVLKFTATCKTLLLAPLARAKPTPILQVTAVANVACLTASQGGQGLSKVWSWIGEPTSCLPPLRIDLSLPPFSTLRFGKELARAQKGCAFLPVVGGSMGGPLDHPGTKSGRCSRRARPHLPARARPLFSAEERRPPRLQSTWCFPLRISPKSLRSLRRLNAGYLKVAGLFCSTKKWLVHAKP